MSQVRDSSLLDAIESSEPVNFAGTVWRVAKEGRDPLLASQSGGRWDDGTFDVLYTSEAKDGAIAEARFYLMKGQPVAPSKPIYELHELQIQMSHALCLLNLDAIRELGVYVDKYGSVMYTQRHTEYPRTQEVGEAAHFLGFHGLMIPNARFNCLNIVLFDDTCEEGDKAVIASHGPINSLLL